MAITLVTGPPGTGKTYYCVREIFDVLRQGKFAVSNVELRPGWATVLAEEYWPGRIRRLFTRDPAPLARVAERYESRFFASTSLEELLSVRVPPCAKCRACKEGWNCTREGRGVIVLDECHEWLNARTWDTDDQGKGMSRTEAIQARMRIVKYASHHRKLGVHMKLITQDANRIDTQVRGNHENHTKLKNMRNFRIFGLVRIVPFNLFVAITYWAAGKERMGVRAYFLRRKIANCYDTMASAVLRLEDEKDDDVIRLPLTRQQVLARSDLDARRDGGWRRTDGPHDGDAGGAAAPQETVVRPVRPHSPVLHHDEDLGENHPLPAGFGEGEPKASP